MGAAEVLDEGPRVVRPTNRFLGREALDEDEEATGGDGFSAGVAMSVSGVGTERRSGSQAVFGWRIDDGPK